MMLFARRLPVWLGIMIMFSGIVTTSAEAADRDVESQASAADFDVEPWGLFAVLAGTVWQSEDYLVRFEWEILGEVMLETAFTSGREFKNRYRLGFDGRTITASGESIDGSRTLSFPSPDTWVITSSSGTFSSGCRKVRDGNNLMCEAIAPDGTRKAFQLTRSDDTAFSAAAQAKDAEKAKWGVLAELVGKDFTAERYCGGGLKYGGSGAVAFRWNDDPTLGRYIAQFVVSDPALWPGNWYAFYWVFDQTTQNMGVFRYANKIRPVYKDALGTLSASAKDWHNGGSRLRLNSEGNGNYLFYSFSGDESSQSIKCSLTLKPADFGSYNKVAERSRALALEADAQKAAQKSDGGGLSGALLGAVIGGALTGGSAEGIINGARALSSDEGARQVYQEYEAQRIAQEQETASYSEAAARVAGYSTADSSVTGSGGQSNYSSSTSRSDNAATRAAAPVARRPLRLFLSVVPAVGEKDKSQPVCVSNVLDLGQVANWPDANGSYQDSAAYDAARPLFASFVALCRNARGDMRTVSPSTVSVTHNAYAGTDLDDERNRIISSHTPNAYWQITM